MKILLIGATGLLGQAVKQELEGEHEIIGAALEGADFNVDMTKPDQIREMFEKIGKVMQSSARPATLLLFRWRN